MNELVRDLDAEEIFAVSGGVGGATRIKSNGGGAQADPSLNDNNTEEDDKGSGAAQDFVEGVAEDTASAVTVAIGTAVGAATRSTPIGVAATILLDNLPALVEAHLEMQAELSKEGTYFGAIGPG